MNVMIRRKILFSSAAFCTLLMLFGALSIAGYRDAYGAETPLPLSPAGADLHYQFSSNGMLHESPSAEASTSPYFWLQSGASLILKDGTGMTIQGDLATNDPRRVEYATAAPITSDNGYHPQNSFKLLTKKEWADTNQQITVTVTNHNLYNPQNNHAWSGVTLISRYQDTDDYYYGSIRMDGHAVIKKKQGGAHATLGSQKVLAGNYDSLLLPSLFSEDAPFTLRLDTKTNSDNTITLTLYLQQSPHGSWEKVLETIDVVNPITEPGRVGIYSDYVDMTLDDYLVVDTFKEGSQETPTEHISSTLPSDLPVYGLAVSGTVEETGSMDGSVHDSWWVNSGAYFSVKDGIGSTFQGTLATDNRWREAYAASNPRDTDNGYHPQNIFRLVTKDEWYRPEQTMYFSIEEYHESDSPLRTGHNGVLFFSRYHDGNNLYYTGIRVDGKAVIKKKKDGTYTTLALTPVLSGSFNRDSNPNLIPEKQWIGLRTRITDEPNGSVRIQVYMDINNDGSWKLVAEAIDSNSPIRGSAHAGIRTDYMDARFKEYTVTEL